MRSPRRQLHPSTHRWPGRRPSLVTILIALNVAAFAVQTLCNSIAPGQVEHWFALSRESLHSGFAWQFFTYMFLHGDPSVPASGPIHLLVNMTTLYFAGRELEGIIGPKHLLGVYLGGGLLGGIGQILVSASSTPLVGASAGVCAVLLAFTTILPEIEITGLLFFIIPIRLKAKYLALCFVIISAACAATGTLGGIGHIAHLGGCLVGWLYVKQLGFGHPLRIQRYVFEKRERAARFERMSAAQFISQEIDPILDKISREGIHSLSRAERKVLEKGREKIAERIGKR